MGNDMINAAVLHARGEAPRYEPFPAPSATDGQAVATVLAAALKPVDRWLADGTHHAAPTEFPLVAGADGVGVLDDGTRVAFLAPVPPYGGMAERVALRPGMWLPVPDGVDDVTAAALANPGLAAWKALVHVGELTEGQSVLVLGATGASGRIAARIARRYGAGRVVAAGRDPRVLETLGADATIRVDTPREELAAAFAAAGPYDLVLDYLWGPPAEALFAALAGSQVPRIRYVQVGISAGATLTLPATALRAAPFELVGNGGTGRRRPDLDEVAGVYRDLLTWADAGELQIDIERVPLADVATAWLNADGRRRVVFVP